MLELSEPSLAEKDRTNIKKIEVPHSTFNQQVFIACRLNQARSQVIASYFTLNYSDLNFESFGVEVRESDFVPNQVFSILRDWGLTNLRENSLRSKSIPDSLRTDATVIAADKYVSDEVRKIVFTGKIYNLEDFSPSPLLTPREPTAKSDNPIEFDLAVNLIAANYAFKNILGVGDSNFKIYSYVASNENSFKKSLHAAANFAQQKSAFLIYTDFKGLLDPSWSDFDLISVPIRNLTSNIDFQSNGEIVVPKWESIYPAQMLISGEFRDFLRRLLIKGRDVVLISAPLKVGGQKRFNSVLSCLNADEVRVIE